MQEITEKMGGVGDNTKQKLIFALKDKFYLFDVAESIPKELIEEQNREADEYIKAHDFD